FAASIEKIVARVGLDHARELYGLSREGVEIVRAAIAADMRAVEAHPGRLHVWRTNDEIGAAAYAEMLSRDFGHDLDLWKKSRVRAAIASERYFHALHEADAFHLNPLLLARMLATEIENHGGRIFEASRVIEADITGLRKLLRTEEGSVRTFNVVLAGSSGIGAGFPWLAKAVLPIRTHVAVTAPLGPKLKQAIRFEGAISDMRRAGDYYHLIGGDRLLWGGRISARRNPPRRLERLMARDITRVYPQLKDIEIEHAWSGVMGYAVHMMPQIGHAAPGIWVSSAFGGQGLNTTAMAGELVASGIAEHDDRWRLFVPFGLVWSGGRTGRAVTQLTYWGMQLGDWTDEVQSRAAERDEIAVRAGLAPGLAAHLWRRAKRRFFESAVGRASVATVRAVRTAAIAATKPFIWTGRAIGAGAVAIWNALVPVIWFIAGVIGFIARAVGRAMDAVANAVKFIARQIARATRFVWQRVITSAAIWVWTKAVLPASARTKAGGQKALAFSHARAVAVGQWSAKQPGIVWNRALVPAGKAAAEKSRRLRQRWAEARKKRNEQKALADAVEAPPEWESDAEKAAETPGAENDSASPADSENGDKPKKKKKKNKKDSVEA
ncbi:MAG TPA: FAD-dependent oxidoreductase, partial [Xanthobacteraceae bacterium]|nr:FAD-dependent oxidoreductase [Xanthobacteraceae bacterium]